MLRRIVPIVCSPAELRSAVDGRITVCSDDSKSDWQQRKLPRLLMLLQTNSLAVDTICACSIVKGVTDAILDGDVSREEIGCVSGG